jgi:hypothetical protein
MDAVAFRPGHPNMWRAALAGALALAALTLLFWASAAAERLPPTAPLIVAVFTPSRGVTVLAAGLFLSAIVGAVLGAAGFGAIAAARFLLRRLH